MASWIGVVSTLLMRAMRFALVSHLAWFDKGWQSGHCRMASVEARAQPRRTPGSSSRPPSGLARYA